MIKWISNIKNAGLILLSILLLTSCASTRGSGQESAATESKRAEGRSIETIEPLSSEPNPIKQEKPESNITESGTTEGDIAEPETTESSSQRIPPMHGAKKCFGMKIGIKTWTLGRRFPIPVCGISERSEERRVGKECRL